MERYCSYCGAGQQIDSLFCDICGNELDMSQNTIQPAPPVQSYQPHHTVQQAPPPTQPYQPAPAHRPMQPQPAHPPQPPTQPVQQVPQNYPIPAHNTNQKNEKFYKTLADSVIAFIEGDVSAFDKIYADTYRKIFVSAKILMKNEHDAEDVVQEVYIQAYNKLATIKDPNTTLAWLQTVTRNTCFNRLRKKSEVLLGEEQEYIMENMHTTDKDAMPEASFMGKEKSTIILELVSFLPLAQKEAILLHFIEKKSIAEIAALTNTSTGTIKSRINYGKSKLRDLVKEKEKKDGVKLYSAGLWLFLPFFLRRFAQTAPLSPEVAQSTLYSVLESTGAAASSGAYGSAAIGSTVGTCVAAAAPYTGIGAVASAVGAKMAAAIIVCTVVAAGLIAAVPVALSYFQSDYDPEYEYVQNETPATQTPQPDTGIIQEETPQEEPDMFTFGTQLYSEVLDRYREVIASGVFMGADHDWIERIAEEQNLCITWLWLLWNPDFQYMSDYTFYAFYDLNNNGTPDLLIGTSQGDIIGIHTWVDGNAYVHSFILGIRADTTALPNGIFVERSSQVMGSVEYTIFSQLSADGRSMDVIDQLVINWIDYQGGTGTFYRNDVEITREEHDSIIHEYFGENRVNVLSFEWHPLMGAQAEAPAINDNNEQVQQPADSGIDMQTILGMSINEVRSVLGNESHFIEDSFWNMIVFDNGILLHSQFEDYVFMVNVNFHLLGNDTLHFHGLNGHSTRSDVVSVLGQPERTLPNFSASWWAPHAFDAYIAYEYRFYGHENATHLFFDAQGFLIAIDLSIY